MSRTRTVRVLIVAAVVMSAAAVGFAPPAASVVTAPPDGPQFSPREIRWAVQWINRDLAVLMGARVFDMIIDQDDGFFQVRIGPQWQNMTFAARGETLLNLSRSREILGHVPFFDVRDRAGEQVVARVGETAVEIMVAGEGFFTLQTDADDTRSTQD